MKPLFIHNVDFIQLLMPVDEVITYFPVSTHLQDKVIHTLHFLVSTGGVDLSAKYPISSPASAFITLYDVDGNLIVDKYPIIYFTPVYRGSTPVIDRVIDWERSFIYWADRGDGSGNKETTCMYFSVFVGGGDAHIPDMVNQYSIELPITSGISEISLYNRLQAIAEKKITGVYYAWDFSLYLQQPDPLVNSYLYLVPKSQTDRYINYISLVSLLNRSYDMTAKSVTAWFYQTVYLDPIHIDFNRSKILVRDPKTTSKSIKLTFYYE